MKKIVNGIEVDCTEEDITQRLADDEYFTLLAKQEAIDEANKLILDQLKELDLQSIRPLRDGSTDKLIQLEEEAALLRAQLIK